MTLKQTLAAAPPTATPTRTARGGLLVIGGGFAGATLAREAGRRGATIVSPENFMLYTPLLPDVAAGTVEPRHVVAPLREMCPHAELILGTAVALNEEARTVTVQTDTGRLVIEYEQLVVAPGGLTRTLPVPGLAEFGVGFKTIEDAVHLRNTVLRRLDQADEAPAEEIAAHLTFVFVGGGYAGVEAVAQLHELAHHALRHYPRLKGVPQRWLLVDAAPRILAAIPGPLGEYATRELERRGIEIHSGTRLESAVDGRIVLSDGTELDARTLVWTAGTRPSPLGARLGLPVDEQGRILVLDTLRVAGRPDIFAIGDCAHVPNAARRGAPDPPTCQHALRQAKRLARNLAAIRAGRRPRRYRYRTRGQMAILGRRRGIAEAFGVPLRGLPAWAFTRAYHLSRLPLRRGRLRVSLDWIVATLLPADIAQLGSLGRVASLGLNDTSDRPVPVADTPIRRAA